MDATSDKLSIKNLLFTKAIPNYVVADPVNGHKLYACTDCGDKFVFETSYNDHINRVTAKISYMCRHCNLLKIFYNRCKLLFHIRSHTFKTATINVADIKIELLPMHNVSSATKTNAPATKVTDPNITPIFCHECKENITDTGIAYKDRVFHFMKYSSKVYSCPVCLFALPNICGLKVHLRLHLKSPPYYCPECGIHLTTKNVEYPYNHDCEGFKMMRATARLNCSVEGCNLFHPNDYMEHMKKYHLRKFYKCPFCIIACFSSKAMQKHLKVHKTSSKPLLFYQCEVCPGRYILQNPKLHDNHLKCHINATVYPCWACGSKFNEVSSLLTHFIEHHKKSEAEKSAITYILDEALQLSKPRMYRVVKKCEQCEQSFTYKCKYEHIAILPNECPFKCASVMKYNITPEISNDSENHITCHLCQMKISIEWDCVKKHYAEFHKSHKCLDAKIVLSRLDVSAYLKQHRNISKICKRNINKRNKLSTVLIKDIEPTNDSVEYQESLICNICGYHYVRKANLEKHYTTHKDPYMAYQCLECGQCFAAKPTFANHLLISHNINDVGEYIANKDCINQDAFLRHEDTDVEIIEAPLEENQCSICREEFQCSEELVKHFRVHGMAFLQKNTPTKN